jgi:hypothetical protein
LRNEHVLDVGLIARNLFDKEYPVCTQCFPKNTRCDPRGLVSQVHLAPVFFGLADSPGRQEQRQQSHKRYKRSGKHEHRADPGQQRQARTEPDHHLGLAVAA